MASVRCDGRHVIRRILMHRSRRRVTGQSGTHRAAIGLHGCRVLRCSLHCPHEFRPRLHLPRFGPAASRSGPRTRGRAASASTA